MGAVQFQSPVARSHRPALRFEPVPRRHPRGQSRHDRRAARQPRRRAIADARRARRGARRALPRGDRHRPDRPHLQSLRAAPCRGPRGARPPRHRGHDDRSDGDCRDGPTGGRGPRAGTAHAAARPADDRGRAGRGARAGDGEVRRSGAQLPQRSRHHLSLRPRRGIGSAPSRAARPGPDVERSLLRRACPADDEGLQHAHAAGAALRGRFAPPSLGTQRCGGGLARRINALVRPRWAGGRLGATGAPQGEARDRRRAGPAQVRGDSGGGDLGPVVVGGRCRRDPSQPAADGAGSHGGQSQARPRRRRRH